MGVRKAESTIRAIICLGMLVIAVLHPRIIYGIAVLICVISCVISYKSKKDKTVAKMCKDVVEGIIGIMILCYCGQCLNILYPDHASYEYRADIADLKKQDLDEYYYFPDKIPKGVSKVEWVCFPDFIRTGYHKLQFYADAAYLNELYDTYEKDAIIYTYDSDRYAWINDNLKINGEIPFVNGMSAEEKEKIEVLMLYDNQYEIQDMDSLHNGGLYINRTDGYVCFWAQ